MADNKVETRNIAIVGFGGSGKTQLADTILFNARVVPTIGKVIDKTSNMVLEEEEFMHLTTITSSVATIDMNGMRFNIIDTPSQDGFIGDTINAMIAADGVIFVMSAQTDIKREGEVLLKYAKLFNLPVIFFMNKMDVENADFENALKEYGNYLGVKITPIAVPIGNGNTFEGVLDLIDKKSYTYTRDGSGKTKQITDKPQDSDAYEKMLIEAVAESDDNLLEKYLNGVNITLEEMRTSMRHAVLTRSLFPVIPGSSLLNMDINKLIEFCSMLLPFHNELNQTVVIKSSDGSKTAEVKKTESEKPVVYIFKTSVDPFAGKLSFGRVLSGTIHSDTTLYNAAGGTEEKVSHLYTLTGKKNKLVDSAQAGDIVAFSKLYATKTGDTLKGVKDDLFIPHAYVPKKLVSYSVKPKGKSDEDKIVQTLNKIIEENTSLSLRRESQFKELIIEGTTKEQIEIAIHKAKRKYGVELELVLPKIPYRETIKVKAEAQGKYKKQSGGRGQYGDVWLRLEPLQRGKGVEFVDSVVGGAIPRQYIPAVEKGLREAAQDGFLAGYPVVDLKATLYDGSYHVVDSSEMAFKIAASLAFKKCIENASPIILEPVMLIEVNVPEEFTGEVIGELNAKRAKILGMDTTEDKKQIVKAHVPLVEVQSYGTELRAITKGMGTFDLQFLGYMEVPSHLLEKLINNDKEVKV